VDQLATGVLGLRQLAFEVVRCERHMMDAAVGILFEELGDGTVGRHGLEEFESGFADLKESGAHFLTGDVLHLTALQAQGFLVVRNRVFERVHRDSKVVDTLQHDLMVFARRMSGKNTFRQ